jgi:osmoprotectant transport system substrate-binding protein
VKHRPWKLLLVLLAALAMIAAGCGDDEEPTDTGGGTTEPPAEVPDGPEIVIGAQDFPESLILSEIFKQGLEAKGYTVSIQELGGFRDLLFGAFDSGDVNLAAEYVASELEFLNDFAGEATADLDETFGKLEPLLAERGLVAFEPSDAANTNAFVVTTETAEELELETISDLAEHASELTLGAVQDCEENAFCIPGLQDVYNIDLSANFTPLDSGLIPDALDNGDIDVGAMFSTDGPLASGEYVVLEDNEGLFNADNIFVVTSEAVAEAYGDDFEAAIDAITSALTTEGLIQLNGRFSADNEDPVDIAADWLADNDLA